MLCMTDTIDNDKQNCILIRNSIKLTAVFSLKLSINQRPAWRNYWYFLLNNWTLDRRILLGFASWPNCSLTIRQSSVRSNFIQKTTRSSKRPCGEMIHEKKTGLENLFLKYNQSMRHSCADKKGIRPQELSDCPPVHLLQCRITHMYQLKRGIALLACI